MLPGEMRALELNGGRGWFAEKDAFVAAEATVDFDIAFSGLARGSAGGEGFVLEKFTGYGTLLIARRRQLHRPQPGDYGGLLRSTPAASSPSRTASATASSASAAQHAGAMTPWRSGTRA